jgi:type I restriction enzyme S subunit
MTSTTTHIDKKEPLVPALRFKEFGGEWSIKRVDQVLKRYSDPVKVQSETEYQQIGIRSHGKGIFHKELVTGSSLGNKRVFWIKKNLFVVNIVFAWEHAVGMTTEAENGMIASHRFPMYESVENFVDTEFIKRFFLRKRGKYLLQLASPGGAGRNKTLGQQMFNELKITFPSLPEQQKIAAFLSAVDEKIRQLTRKKELLEQYKKGVMQKLASQELRFKDENGNPYPDWEEKKLEDISECLDNKRIPLNSSVREQKRGNIPYYGANNIMDYIDEYIFDETIVLLAEDGGYFEEFQTRPIAQISHGKSWVNNHAHVLKAKNGLKNEFLYYSLVHKNILGYVNTGTRSKLNKNDMLKIKIGFPYIEEQQKIADYLSARSTTKIASLNNQITQTQTFKKGLLQQMFV